MNWDKANEIYEGFIEHVMFKGWKGKFYTYREVVRGDPHNDETSMHFELANGFNLMLSSMSVRNAEKVSFKYWFEENSKEQVEVKSLEQLIWLTY